MANVLITGATCNVGMEVIKSLERVSNSLNIYAGIRNVETDKLKLSVYKINFVRFDFTNIQSYEGCLQNIDILFLLRPPQISQVKKYFKPLIDAAQKNGVKHIIFLSVEGAEKSSFIPHHKIEQLIIESKIHYTFLRPAYFMQNFTTTLQNDLVNNKNIFLPAGKAKFTLVNVNDVGAVSAQIITKTNVHINMAYELTCNEKLSFGEMAEKLSEGLATHIQYISSNLFQFYFTKRKEKVAPVIIFIMIMLHYFRRFQKERSVTKFREKITGQPAKSFEQFIIDNKDLLI